MSELSRKNGILPAELLCAPVAAASYVCAIMFSLQSGHSPLSIFLGSAAIIAIFFLLQMHIRNRDSLTGGIILLILLFLYASARPGLLSFNGGHISSILIALALYLSSKESTVKFRDVEAKVSALITAASFATPPIMWLLPIYIVHSLFRTRNAKSAAAGTAGAVITCIIAGSILFLAGGIERVTVSSAQYLSDISGISLIKVSFRGWKTVETVVFLLVIIATIIRYTMYRTKASAAEAAISGSAGIIICTSLTLTILFAGEFADHLILLASIMSAFLLSILATIDGEKKFARILMITLATSAAIAIASEFFPEMDDVFSYIYNHSSLWK